MNDYTFEYEIQVSDLWKASMYYAWSSYLAVINSVCIVSSVLLLIVKYESSPGWFRILMILFFMAFTVFQPLIILARSSVRLQGKERHIRLHFTLESVQVTAGDKTQVLSWADVMGLSVKRAIVIVYLKNGEGYILNNKVLGRDRAGFIEMVERIKRRK